MRSFADMVFLFDSHWFALGGSEVTPYIKKLVRHRQELKRRSFFESSQQVHDESTSPWRVNKFWPQGASMRETSSRGHYLVEVHAWYYVLWVEQAKRMASFKSKSFNVWTEQIPVALGQHEHKPLQSFLIFMTSRLGGNVYTQINILLDSNCLSEY